MRKTTLAAMSSFLVAHLGCSALLDFEVRQCSTERDCRAPAFTGGSWTCERGLCVQPESTVGPAPDAGAPCERHRDCGGFALEHVCVEGRCMPLLDGDVCPVKFPRGPLEGDALVLGAFGDTRPGSKHLLNYELAVAELNVARLPPNRSLVLVVCNGLSGDLPAGFEHLAETLEVPGLIAGAEEMNAMADLFLEQRSSQKVFFLAPGESDGTPSSPDLLIYLLGHVNDYGPPLARLLDQTERFVERTRELSAVRVAVLKPEGGFGEVLWQALMADLVVNGKSAFGAVGDGDARVFPVGRDVALHEGVRDEVAAYAPDIVLVLTDDEIHLKRGPDDASLFDRLEETWAERGTNAPVYVLSPQNAFRPEIVAYVSEDAARREERRRRFVGVRAASAPDSEILADYEERFLLKFPKAADKLGAENYYDAVYFLTYAAIAARPDGGSLTGPELRAGFDEIIAGPEISVGPAGTMAAYSRLVANDGIRLIGTLGAPDFDPSSGAREGNGSVTCLVDRDGQIVPEFDVLRYDKTTKQLEPAKEFCFEGFLE